MNLRTRVKSMTDLSLLKLSQTVGHLLEQRGWMMASAESCTGGGVAQAVTEIAGSSVWFDRAFITYSNEAKQQMLGVEKELIEDVGAVSEEVASAMAAGALRHSMANIAVSVTGIAGPGGGTPAKPVGTVCFGLAVRDQAIQSETQYFTGDRAAVRKQSVYHALQLIEKYVESN